MFARLGLALLIVSLFPLSHVTAQEPQLTRGPYLQGLFEDRVEIRWRSDVITAGDVVLTGDDGSVVQVRFPARRDHRVGFRDLRPRTRYTYRIANDGILDGPETTFEAEHFQFTTAPIDGEGSFRAVALGDSGVASVAQLDLAEVLESFEADIFVHTGDILYLDDVDRGVFRPYEEVLSRTCFFPARGNHDFTLERDGPGWRELFRLPGDEPGRGRVYYSYDWGPAHFLALDYHNTLADGEAQVEFARQDLAAARERGAKWIILYLHIPIISVGQYANLTHSLREAIPPICDEFGVDLVLSGHDHNYQRTHPVLDRAVRDAWQGDTLLSPRGTIYMITGGGGANLYRERSNARQQPLMAEFHSRHHCVVLDVSTESLRIRAVGIDGETFDDLTIRKDVPRPPPRFLRGDSNVDGKIDITDAVGLIEWLFLGGDLPCPPAASGFDDGAPVVVTHAVYLLDYLFKGGEPPIAPFPECAEVPDADDAFCYVAGCGV